jgi:hypothetical protein
VREGSGGVKKSANPIGLVPFPSPLVRRVSEGAEALALPIFFGADSDTSELQDSMRGRGNQKDKAAFGGFIAGLMWPDLCKWLRGRDLNPRPLGYEFYNPIARLLSSIL